MHGGGGVDNSGEFCLGGRALGGDMLRLVCGICDENGIGMGNPRLITREVGSFVAARSRLLIYDGDAP